MSERITVKGINFSNSRSSAASTREKMAGFSDDGSPRIMMKVH